MIIYHDYLIYEETLLEMSSGRPQIALHCLLLMLVSTPLRIVNRYSSGFPL